MFLARCTKVFPKKCPKLHYGFYTRVVPHSLYFSGPINSALQTCTKCTSFIWHRSLCQRCHALVTCTFCIMSCTTRSNSCTSCFQVKKIHQEKKLDILVDKDLKNNYDRMELEELVKVALLCTQYLPGHRPKMSEVVRMLEGDGLAERWEASQGIESTGKFRTPELSSSERYSDLTDDSSLLGQAIELSGPRWVSYVLSSVSIFLLSSFSFKLIFLVLKSFICTKFCREKRELNNIISIFFSNSKSWLNP